MVIYHVHARLAQLVEQLIYTHQVGGSSPSARTKMNFPGLTETLGIKVDNLLK